MQKVYLGRYFIQVALVDDYIYKCTVFKVYRVVEFELCWTFDSGIDYRNIGEGFWNLKETQNILTT